MALSHELITVYASASSPIHPPTLASIPEYATMVTVTVQNLSGGNYVYLGNNGTSSASYGFRLSPNQSISYDMNPMDNLHALSSDTSTQIAITRLYWQ